MNRIIKTILLFLEIVLGYLILSGKVFMNCIIKQIFHISCPACGFTRAFRAILKGNLLEAMQYNLLSIPVFLFLIVVNGYLIYDIVTNRKKIDSFFEKLGKCIVPILIILLLNMIINNVRRM